MSALAMFVYMPGEAMHSPVPDTVPAMTLPEIDLMPFTPLWDNMPPPVHSVKPEPFQIYGKDYVFMLYSTRLTGQKSGKLTVTGMFFRGSFSLDTTADTYIDVTNFIKGFVWVNGKYLGRYWEIEPQQRLYCPASWLKIGENEIIIFDLHKTEPSTVRGFKTINQN